MKSKLEAEDQTREEIKGGRRELVSWFLENFEISRRRRDRIERESKHKMFG